MTEAPGRARCMTPAEMSEDGPPLGEGNLRTPAEYEERKIKYRKTMAKRSSSKRPSGARKASGGRPRVPRDPHTGRFLRGGAARAGAAAAASPPEWHRGATVARRGRSPQRTQRGGLHAPSSVRRSPSRRGASPRRVARRTRRKGKRSASQQRRRSSSLAFSESSSSSYDNIQHGPGYARGGPTQWGQNPCPVHGY